MNLRSQLHRRLSGIALGLLLGALLPVAEAAAQDPATGAAASDDPCRAGQEAFRAGKLREAEPLLRSCLEKNGDSVEILMPLTVLSLQAQKRDDALAFSDRAVALADQDPEVRYWRGRALLAAGRVDEARSQWETGLAISAEHKGILEGLAKLAMAEGETAKAYNLLNQLQRVGVDEPWVHRLLADIAASKGLWTQTLEHLHDVMAREEPDLGLLLLGSEVALMAEEPDTALDFGRRAVQIQPGAESYGGLGEVFFAREEVDSALVYLRRAVALDPNASRARFNLANALEVQGLTAEAETEFQAFLLQEPEDPVGQFNYGIHLQKLGQLDAALEHVSLAVMYEPGMLSARVVRAQMLELLGRYDEAIADVAFLRQADAANAPELAEWERALRVQAADEGRQRPEGHVHLLHLVVPDPALAQRLSGELAAGAEFSGLAVQYSVGPGAQRGGDIGWMAPADLVEPMRSAVMKLQVNEISPPVESGGLYHIFKRIP